MNKNLFLTLLCLLVADFAVAQKPIYTKAKVNAVNVYRNSAELQNTAAFSVPAGMSEVVVRNISDKIDDKTLQIGVNNKNVTILSSQFTDDYSSVFEMDVTNSQIKKVSDSIKFVESMITKSAIELEANVKSVELLDKNQTVLVGSNTSNVLQLTQLTEFYTKKRIELSNKIVDIKKNSEKLQKQLTRLKSSLKTNEEKEAEKFAKGVVVLKIMNKSAGSVKLSLNYLARNVSWEPYYEIKGENISQPLSLTLKANVKQNTGLDWKAVKLTLINGVSFSHNIAPVLEPWFLYAQSNQTVNVRGYASAKVEQAAEVAYSNIQADGDMVTSSAGFEISSNQLNVSYNVDVPYDILSNNENHLISLYQQNIPAEYEYFSIPNYNNIAFLMAKVKDFSQYGLVAARASIVFENMYVGETYINPNQAENELNITLGNDRRINIKRENIKDKVGEKFLSSYREKTIAYDLIVRNNKKESINIEIKDRIPLSNNESVKVELLEISGATKDDEKGFLTWNIKVAASETKKIRVSYKVKFPKDYTINL